MMRFLRLRRRPKIRYSPPCEKNPDGKTFCPIHTASTREFGKGYVRYTMDHTKQYQTRLIGEQHADV